MHDIPFKHELLAHAFITIGAVPYVYAFQGGVQHNVVPSDIAVGKFARIHSRFSVCSFRFTLLIISAGFDIRITPADSQAV